jgi:hypothetical protein
MPSIHKRPQDVVGEVDGGSNTSEERRCKNKRSRMHSEDSQTSLQFHSSPDNLPLSTNNQLSGSTTVENDISQDDLISALNVITRAIATSESRPPHPTHTGELPGMSPPAASFVNAELQCQLFQMWDVKRVQELAQQGK